MIERFVRALTRAGVKLDDRQIAECLWLARHLPANPKADPAPRSAAASPAPVSHGHAEPRLPVVTETPATPPAPEPAPVEPASGTPEAGGQLYTPPQDLPPARGRGAIAVRVPAAAALPQALDVARSLRPLGRRRPSPRRVIFDEEETVRYVADGGPWAPRFRPALERWFDVCLVVERTPSMAVWERTLAELERLLVRHGAFRDVRIWHMEAAGGTIRLNSRYGAQRRVRELIDGTGRRLTVVVSDCVSDGWYDGTFGTALRQWAEQMPVVVAQTLPKSLWPRTALGRADLLVSAPAPGAPNSRLTVNRPRWFLGPSADGPCVPVVTLEPRPLAIWSRMLADPGHLAPAVALPAGAGFEDEDEAPPPAVNVGGMMAEDRVRRFRALASPNAFALATFLTAVPLTLPVMRLVQRAMLSKPAQVHLAEVFLGGIIERVTPATAAVPADGVQYDFCEGVRERLAKTLLRSDFLRVVEAVSELVEQRAGHPVDFDALLGDAEGANLLPEAALPFAQVAADVWHRLGGRRYARTEEAEAAPKPETSAPCSAPPPPRFPVKPRCFGRGANVAALVSAMVASKPRPALVLGGSGVGKTTVTLAALHHSAVTSRFAERRWFVRLDEADGAAGLASQISKALGVPPTGDPLARIAAELAKAPALLVLDHLDSPWERERKATERVLARLASVPGLALVASLRGADRPEHVSWHLIDIGPLDPEAMRAQFEAVAGRSFGPDPALYQLLDALDGVALAVELMARLARNAPLATLWDRWQVEGTGMLRTGEGKGRLDSVAASYDGSILGRRMTGGARRLLSIMGILSDGISHRDRVALLGDVGKRGAKELRSIGLSMEDDGRLCLPIPLRNHVAAHYPPSKADMDHTVRHYMDLAKQGERAGGIDGGKIHDRLKPEMGNIEAAIRLGLKGALWQRAVDSALQFGRFAALIGQGLPALLEAAAGSAGLRRDYIRQATCIQSLGFIAMQRSDHDGARVRFEEALALYRRLGDVLGEANCIQGFGEIAMQQSDFDGAWSRFEEALALYRRIGGVLGEANCITALGKVAERRSDFDGAWSRFEEALVLYRRIREVLGEANCIHSLGKIAMQLSDFDGAWALFEEALVLYRRIGGVLGEANCIHALGDVAIRRSDHDGARARFEEALVLYRRIEDLMGEANCIHALGDVAMRRSDHDGARALFEEALVLYRRIGGVLGEANCIHALGDVAMQRFDHDGAWARFEEASVLYRRIGGVLGEANCIKAFGNVARRRSDNDGARARFEEALVLHRRIGNVLGEASCIQGFGEIAMERSEFDRARALFEEALALYRRIGGVLGEANCIHALGDVAIRRSDHDGARSRFEEALVLYRRIEDLLGEANCIQGFGEIAMQRSDHDGAWARFEEALALYRHVEDLLGEANCIQGFGEIAMQQSDFDGAWARFEEALALFRKVGDIEGEGKAVRGIGDVTAARSDHNEARRRYDDALVLFGRIPSPLLIGGTHQRLARIAQSEGERQSHLDTARAAWRSVGLGPLIAALDEEFKLVG